MSTIPFVKYTHCGNNFVIVDELSQPHIPEREKPLFAYQASDVSFGIGSDGLLVIQPFNTDVVQAIDNTYGYWDTLPVVTANCDYIFRLFESNMREALACGNGLLCIISYLYERYAIDNAYNNDEVPLAQPNIIAIGVERENKMVLVQFRRSTAGAKRCCTALGYRVLQRASRYCSWAKDRFSQSRFRFVY